MEDGRVFKRFYLQGCVRDLVPPKYKVLIDWGDHLARSGDSLVWRACDQPHRRECFPLSLCNPFTNL